MSDKLIPIPALQQRIRKLEAENKTFRAAQKRMRAELARLRSQQSEHLGASDQMREESLRYIERQR